MMAQTNDTGLCLGRDRHIGQPWEASLESCTKRHNPAITTKGIITMGGKKVLLGEKEGGRTYGTRGG